MLNIRKIKEKLENPHGTEKMLYLDSPLKSVHASPEINMSVVIEDFIQSIFNFFTPPTPRRNHYLEIERKNDSGWKRVNKLR